MKQVIDLTSTPTPPKPKRTLENPQAANKPEFNAPGRYRFDRSTIDPGFWDEPNSDDDFTPASKKFKHKKRTIFGSDSDSESPEEYDISSAEHSEDSENWIERETSSSSQTPQDLLDDFDQYPFRRTERKTPMNLPAPSDQTNRKKTLLREIFGSDSDENDQNPFMMDDLDGGEDAYMREDPVPRSTHNDFFIVEDSAPRDRKIPSKEKPTLHSCDRDRNKPNRRITEPQILELEDEEEMLQEEFGIEPRTTSLTARHPPREREIREREIGRETPMNSFKPLRPRDRSSRFDPPRSEVRSSAPPVHATSSLRIDRPIHQRVVHPRRGRDWSPPREMFFGHRRASDHTPHRKRFRDEFDDDIEAFAHFSEAEERHKKPKHNETSTESDEVLARRLQMQEYGQPSYRLVSPNTPLYLPHHLGNNVGPSLMLHPHMMPHHFNSFSDFHRQTASHHHFHHAPPSRANSNPLYHLQYKKGDFTADDYEMLLALDKDVKKKTLTKKQISGIKHKVVKSKTDEAECVICLDICSVGAKVKVLTCAHQFHAECIDKWLHESKACPICKAEAA